MKSIIFIFFVFLISTIVRSQPENIKVHYDTLLYNENDSLYIISNKYLPNTKVRIPFTITIGKFKNNAIYNGEIEYYSSEGKLLFSILYKEGKKQEGIIYKGETLNLKDRLGKNEGIWMTPRRANFRNNQIKTDELYEGFWHIVKYKSGINIDTGYFYNELGDLTQVFIYATDSTSPQRTFLNAEGSIIQIDYFKPNEMYKHIIYKSVWYSDFLTGCISKRASYSENAQKIDFTYEYRDCQLYSKTSVKEKYLKPEETEYYDEQTVFIDGEMRTIRIKQELPTTATLEPVPYTVEVGEFDLTEFFLVNGTINYYTEKGVLIESKKVIDSVIVE